MECKMAEGSSVGERVVKMISYAERLKTLAFSLPPGHMMDMLLSSLPPSYDGFVKNYNMPGMEKTPKEVLTMLKNTKAGLRKNRKQVLLVNKTASFKKKGKPKKGKGAGKTGSQSKSKGGAKDGTECFYYKGTGHWKRNCNRYLEDKKSGKIEKGINVIQVNVIDILLASENSKSWVFDTGSVAHICNSIQGLQKVRKLAKNEVVMRVRNGDAIAAQAVGIMPLRLPSGFILELSNGYFVLALCRNIISGSCLIHDGYSYKSKNIGCSLYCKEMFYGYAPIVGGLFILNLECGNDVFNVNAKCLKKVDTTTTFLWHCRLGHNEKKRMQRL
jgi:hypothetical protein